MICGWPHGPTCACPPGTHDDPAAEEPEQLRLQGLWAIITMISAAGATDRAVTALHAVAREVEADPPVGQRADAITDRIGSAEQAAAHGDRTAPESQPAHGVLPPVLSAAMTPPLYPQAPHAGQAPTPDAPGPRRRRWPWILAAMLGVVVLLAATVGATLAVTSPPSPTASPTTDTDPAIIHASDLPADTPPASSTAPTTIDITYEVTGTGTVDMTYTADQSGNSAQANELTLPWTFTFTLDDSVDGGNYSGLYISAQRKSGDSGSITCRITSGGVAIAAATAKGPYAIATCHHA